MLKHTYAALVGLLFHFAMLSPAAAQSCTPHWEAGWHLPGAVGDTTLCQLEFNDGSGLALYVGGTFSSVGNVRANNVARWNGSSWQPVGDGLITPTGSMFSVVRSLCLFDSGNGPELYAAGKFRNSGATDVCAVAKWNGSSWVSLGIPYNVDAEAMGMAVFDDDGPGPIAPALYVGCYFVSIPGVPGTKQFIRWNGTTWSAPTQPPGSLIPSTLKVLDDGNGPALYAGGVYTGINHAMQKWNGSSWTTVSGFVDGTIHDAVFFDHDGAGPSPATLHIAGDFTAIGAPAANRLARWDGAAWQAAGLPNSYVYTLSVVDGQLRAGGAFSTIGGVAVPRVAVGDGASWAPLREGGCNGSCYSLMTHDLGGGPTLYLTGNFTLAGSAIAHDVARVNNGAWNAMSDGEGVNNSVKAYAIYNDGSGEALYACGDFTTAGEIVANRIAKRTRDGWQSLGTGLNGSPTAMHVYDAGLGDGPQLFVVGQQITNAGGLTVSKIARWAGSAWQDVGGGITTGTSATAPSMAVFDEDGPGPGRPALFVAGELFTAGGVTVNGIARWDGISWSAVGSLASTAISGLAVYNDGGGPALFAAGGFSGTGNPIRALAKWNGATWSAVSPALETGSLNNLHAGPDGLYGYGGVSISGNSLNGVLRWNPSGWTLLAPFLTTKGFATFDDGSGAKVYMFGSTYGSGAALSRLGYWNGSAIVPTSGPLQLTGNAGISTLLAAQGGPFDGLWVGGTNTFTVGGLGSNMAHFIGCAPCPADIVAGDRQVNVSDLLGVITSWGRCPALPATCIADINHDGNVNVTDLLAVITSWGACP